MRESWTDERLDDLNHRVDAGFSEIPSEFRASRRETHTEIGEVHNEIKDFRREVRAELTFLTRLFIGLYSALILALVSQHL